MKEMRDLLRHDAHDVKALLERRQVLKTRGLVQIYEDQGDDFKAETSYYMDDPRVTEYEENDYSRRIKVRVERDTTRLRIDPALSCCVVNVRKVTWMEQELPLTIGEGRIIATNGAKAEQGNVYVFTNEDPLFIFDINRLRAEFPGSGEEELEMEWDITLMPADMAAGFIPAPKPKRRFHF